LSLRNDTVGKFNTAIGAGALFANTADENTATGAGALLGNTTGGGNTAHGAFALFSNRTGTGNTAIGDDALIFNTTGDSNTAAGGEALLNNTTGVGNTAVGSGTILGNTSGNYNIALGYLAGSSLTTGDDNIYIGSSGAEESNTIRIGSAQTATYIAGINGSTVVGGSPVLVDSSSKLGTMTSSERFKESIQPMDRLSEALFSLNPVAFRYKKEIDPKGTRQLGLVAEEVEKVNPDLVVHDKEGKPYSVRYEQVNAMLLNEFLKEHRKVEKLEATVAQQEKQIQLLTAGVQRVGAKVQMIKATRKVVRNNP
jgi:hypothetical protein